MSISLCEANGSGIHGIPDPESPKGFLKPFGLCGLRPRLAGHVVAATSLQTMSAADIVCTFVQIARTCYFLRK